VERENVEGIKAGIGLTAVAVAATRAIETHRPDRLMADPFAERFVAAADPPVPMPTRPGRDVVGFWLVGTGYIGLRSRFLDDFCLAAAADGVRQVVVLAAGLDARAYRLDWPDGTDLYEVDQPKVLEFKQDVLDAEGAEPRCHRHPVPADLRDDWAGTLGDAGFDQNRPTAWLVEGLTPYLPPRMEKALFETVHELSATGSRVAMDTMSRDAARAMADSDWSGVDIGVRMTDLMNLGDRHDSTGWLRSAGWDVDARNCEEVARQYRREIPGAEHILRSGGLVSAVRT
jgi:methyltransferase (TIGR00027 family)